MFSKKIFISSWIGSFVISLSSGLYVKTISQTIGSLQFQNSFQVRGWPYYFMVTNVDEGWTVRQNNFIINAIIWWLGITGTHFTLWLIQKYSRSLIT